MGIIYSVMGTGASPYNDGIATAATVNNPYGVAVTSQGDIIIADTNNHRVRKVTYHSLAFSRKLLHIHVSSHQVTSLGIISTIAGMGASTSAPLGDGGPASMANLYAPRGVFVASNGDIYIADTYNKRIRLVHRCYMLKCQHHRAVVNQINSAGIIVSVAGGGSGGDGVPATAASLWNPNTVVVSPNGDIYFADTGSNRIRKASAIKFIFLIPLCRGINMTLILFTY